MCIGIPMQVLSVDGIAATASDGERTELIDLSLTGDVIPGTWVLTFLGAAREVIDADEAAKIQSAVRALQNIMAGGDAGDAFDDIETKGPSLPPHLQAALDEGKTTA